MFTIYCKNITIFFFLFRTSLVKIFTIFALRNKIRRQVFLLHRYIARSIIVRNWLDWYIIDISVIKARLVPSDLEPCLQYVYRCLKNYIHYATVLKYLLPYLYELNVHIYITHLDVTSNWNYVCADYTLVNIVMSWPRLHRTIMIFPRCLK